MIVKISVPKQVSRLHLATGCLPEELANLASFYLVRSKPGKLMFEDLDDAIECGMLNERPSLRNLEQACGCCCCVCVYMCVNLSAVLPWPNTHSCMRKRALNLTAPTHADHRQCVHAHPCGNDGR